MLHYNVTASIRIERWDWIMYLYNDYKQNTDNNITRENKNPNTFYEVRIS